MRHYRRFFDEQQLSGPATARLLALEPGVRRTPAARRRWAAAVASLAILIGIGAGVTALLQNRQSPAMEWGGDAYDPSALGPENYLGAEPSRRIEATPPADAMLVELTAEELEALLPAGETQRWWVEKLPASKIWYRGESGQTTGVLWHGVPCYATAVYSAGELFALSITGSRRDGTAYTLDFSFQPLCDVLLDEEWNTVVGRKRDIPAQTWSQCYNGKATRSCRFLMGDVLFQVETFGPSEETEKRCSRIVGQLADGSYFHWDHLLVQRIRSLEEAGQMEKDFAPYLPTGYGVEAPPRDFSAQVDQVPGEGRVMTLSWSRGEAPQAQRVWMEVQLPEGGELPLAGGLTLVDVNVPESYDYRLYADEEIPAEYQANFLTTVAFRAEEVTPDAIAARGKIPDGGSVCHTFRLLFPEGALVTYDCQGLTARELWGLVIDTLPKENELLSLVGSYDLDAPIEEGRFVPCLILLQNSFYCGSDLASSHICSGRWTVREGKVIAECDQHCYIFEIVDRNTLRFLEKESPDRLIRYSAPWVGDGALFRCDMSEEDRKELREKDYTFTLAPTGEGLWLITLNEQARYGGGGPAVVVEQEP